MKRPSVFASRTWLYSGIFFPLLRLFSRNALKVKRFAESAALEELAALCENYIKEHFEEISQEDSFYTDLTLAEMDNYLSLDELGVWSEDSVVQIIDKWASLRGPNGQQEARGLVKHLRPGQLSEECINTTAESRSLCKEAVKNK